MALAVVRRNCAGRERWRSPDGSFNSLDHPRMGMAGSRFGRNFPLPECVPDSGDELLDPSLREMIDFRVDNLLSPAAPLGEYDLILCRNVLLYFPSERKRQIFDLLARHCSADGILLLGAGETILGHTEGFVVSSKHRGAYERAQSPAGPSFPRQTVPPGPFPA